MNTPDYIPWEAAKEFAEKFGQGQIIILCCPPDQSITHVITWGTTLAQSADAAAGGNRLKNWIWPKGAPHQDEPKWLADLIRTAEAAESALLSYQHGNDSIDLAADCANALHDALTEVRNKRKDANSVQVTAISTLTQNMKGPHDH